MMTNTTRICAWIVCQMHVPVPEGAEHDLGKVALEAMSDGVGERERLREALTDIRNRVLCPVGPSPSLDDLGAIASAALSQEPQTPKGGFE